MKFTELLDTISNIIEKNANKNYQFVMLRYLLIVGSSSKKDIAIELQNYNQDVKKDYRDAGDVFKVLTESKKDLVTEKDQMFSINNFDKLNDEQRYSLINKCGEKILVVNKIKNSGSMPTHLDMTWKDAAFKVLKEENKPLNRVRITDLILKRHYVKEHNALTPYETVARDMDKDIENSNESLFKKLEPGIYGLNDSNFGLDTNDDLLLMGHKLFLMEIEQRKNKEKFRDFNHTDLNDDEVKYKINILENSLKILSLDEWDEWKSTPEKICLSVRNAVAKKISENLIWAPPHTTEISYFDELDDDLKKQLGVQLYEFFKGKNPIEQRFDNFILFLKKINRVPEIRLLAFLMFLYNSKKYFPIHPTKFDKLLDFYNILKIKEDSWKKYSKYLELASNLKLFLARLNLGNNLSAIQVQSYMWVIAGEVSKKFWMVRAGTDGNDWNNQKNAGIIGIHYETIDLSKFTRTKNRSTELKKIELQKQIKEIINSRGDDIKKKSVDSMVKQLREFFSINRNRYGAKIIAIGDNSTVLGVGNPSGLYEFRTDISKYCHTIPVEWTDTKNRQISTINNFNQSVKEIDVKGYLKLIEGEYLTSKEEELDAVPEKRFQYLIDENKKNQLRKYKTILDQSKGQIIFYGPPGTGKTYIAKQLANIITDVEPDEKWITSSHRKIVQFHPSYSYEDFVQGIKPAKYGDTINYKLQPGIFQKLCTPISQSNSGETPSTMLDCAIFVLVKEGKSLTYDEIHRRTMNGYASQGYGPLYNTTSKNHSNNQRWMLNHDQRNNEPTIFIHPSSSEWNLNPDHSEFKKHKRMYSETETLGVDKDPKVLIIDEINRGNLSKIFGELIYALEYRDEEIDLQYKEFSEGNEYGTLTVPPKDQLMVIGTMNTADRSIILFDAALRRRFSFIPLLPNYDLLAQFLDIDKEFDETEFKTRLKSLEEDDKDEKKKILSILALYKINLKLSNNVSVGREKQIGHTFLLEMQEHPENFIKIWKQDILPLLEEYYFESSDILEDWFGSDVYSNEKGIIMEFDDKVLEKSLDELIKKNDSSSDE